MPPDSRPDPRRRETGGQPEQKPVAGKWVLYAILFFALLHMVFFFAQTVLFP